MSDEDYQYAFIGNNLAVDFANTEMIIRGERVDLLQAPVDLSEWAVKAGVPVKTKISNRNLNDAKLLRHAIAGSLKAVIEQKIPSDEQLVAINKYLATHSSHHHLQANQQTGKLEMTAGHGTTSFEYLLSEIAFQLSQLVASPQAEHLKPCSNPECILLFVDTSRTHRRRWCSMETCGNRAKAAKHYKKHSN